MYSIEVPDTVHQYIKKYYLLRIWSYEDVSPFMERTLNCLHFIFLVSFVTLLAVGAYVSEIEDEKIFLAVVTIAYLVLLNRLWYIIWRKDKFLSLIQQVGTHYTDDQNEFVNVRNKLNGFIKFIRFYNAMLITDGLLSVLLYPIVNEKHLLLFNIPLPIDRSSIRTIGFWMAYVFNVIGVCDAVLSIVFMTLHWYLMFSLSIEYQLLGCHLKRMGTVRSDLKMSKDEQHKFFEKELNVAIKTYERINGVFDEFGLYFGNSIFLQIATGSACICGGLYSLVFSSFEHLGQHVYKCAFLVYSIFDIFVVMYFGAQITTSSDELSKCLHESNWIEQTQPCKTSVIILTERLKQPQELFVGKIYPLNLLTFTSITNGAYSMLNILLTLRE